MFENILIVSSGILSFPITSIFLIISALVNVVKLKMIKNIMKFIFSIKLGISIY